MNLLYNPPQSRKVGTVEEKDGQVLYRNYRGELHRENGPAVVSSLESGPREEYYFHGVLHRDDGPARIWSDGSFEYYQKGLLAGGGPSAKRFFSGEEPREEWRNNEGQLHRIDGPALIEADGSELYYVAGQLHRTDGPAIERRNSLEARKGALKRGQPFAVWYKHGQKSRHGGPAEIYGLGAHVYWLDGQMHRTDGPAIVHMDRITPQGYRQGFMRHGRPHRQDGPAIVDALGVEYYYQEGVLHRADGPAISSPHGGDDEYYLKGDPLTKEDWQDIIGS